MEIRNKNFDLSSIFQSISAGVCYSMAIFSKPPIINICSFFPSKTPSNLNTITTPNYTKPAKKIGNQENILKNWFENGKFLIECVIR
jgi:hypothetical protein